MTLQELRSQFPAAPEYLTQILLIERDNGIVPNAKLADRLEVSRPAVSQAVGRLKKLGLVDQDRYGAIGLSADGRDFAEKVVRRHFLLEHLLVRILDYPWDKSDVEAETLQASLSDELTAYLAEKLGNPQTCPHGNPMPGASIEKSYLEAPKLSEAGVGTRVKVIRITEEGEMADGMLSFCQANGIAPGKSIEIIAQGENGCTCKVDGKDVKIQADFARHIRWEAA